MALDRYYYNLYLKLKREKSIDLAKEALSKTILLNPKADYYYELALLFRQNGQWWQTLANLKKALELKANPEVKWIHLYIEALYKMNHFSDIIKAFSIYDNVEFEPFHYIIYGYALEKEGKIKKANEIFDRVIQLDNQNNSKTLGIGIFYEKKGYWIDSLKRYLAKSINEPFNSLLYYKTGLSYDRNYKWSEAEKKIEYAIALDSSKAYFFNRLAFNYERQEKFLEASEAYKVVILKDKNSRSNYLYRLGYSLYYANRYKESCKIFLELSNIQSTNNILEDKIIKKGSLEILKKIAPLVKNINHLTPSKEIENLVKLTTKAKLWSQLEKVYQWIVDNDKDCSPKNYINLGYSQYKQKKYKQASLNFIEQRVIQKVHSISEKKFNTDRGFRIVATYAEYFKRESLKENYILYESEGEFVESNSYKILLSLLDNDDFKNYRHIIVTDNIKLFDSRILEIKNIIFVSKESNLYLKYLASAKYLINDGIFPKYFIKQEKQQYLNISQNFEVEISTNKETLINKAIVSRDLLQTSHIISSNKSLEQEFSLNGIYAGVVNFDNLNIRESIDFFFYNKDVDYLNLINTPNKKSILIYASFEANGITSALLNLLNVIDKSKYLITLIIDNNTITGYEDIIMEFARDMNILVRVGRMVITLEEQWVREKFDIYKKLESTEMENILKAIFSREFKRLFGNYRFDTIIDFNGYRTFWSSIFAFGNANTKCIYLHSDMYKEFQLRYPSLEKTFFLYKNFDKLISVSEVVSNMNIEAISSKLDISKDKFHFISNFIDYNKYRKLADIKISSNIYQEFISDKRVKFINVARLSPEKGQIRLIKAFNKVLEKRKEISLYIIGDGDLKDELLKLINEYKLNSYIKLLGYQKNPYPFIKNSDCMVLSSLHEGQGLVLLEALSLGTLCISTDIPGPRSILNSKYGILCQNSIDGIKEGIEKFLNKDFKIEKFNVNEYNKKSLNMFLSILD